MVSVRESQGGAIKASMKFHAVTSCRCWSISLWADAVSHAALTISRYILSIKTPTRFTVIRQLHDSVSGVSNLWRAAVVVRDSITSSDSLLKTCKTVKQKVSCSHYYCLHNTREEVKTHSHLQVIKSWRFDKPTVVSQTLTKLPWFTGFSLHASADTLTAVLHSTVLEASVRHCKFKGSRFSFTDNPNI